MEKWDFRLQQSVLLKIILRRSFSVVLLVAIVCFSLHTSAGENHAPERKRQVTVRDVIQMTRLADPLYLLGSPSEGRVAHFSPDGRRFVVVLAKGDLEQNTNGYFILLFEASSAFSSPKPNIVLTMSSSSNRPAIQDIKWLGDNETLIFMGENPGESAQVFTLNVETKHLERLTTHSTSLAAFDAAKDGQEIIFAADPAAKKMIDTERVRKNGIVVRNQLLNSLLEGDCGKFVPTFLEGEELFIKTPGTQPRQVRLEDVIVNSTALSLSPDGRYALIEAFVRDVPKLWEGYKETLIHEYATEQREKGAASILRRYLLLDVRHGTIAPLLDTPLSFDRTGFAWSPDGRSVVLSGAYLPLTAEDSGERERREKNTYVVEISLADKTTTIVTEKQLALTAWDRESNILLLNSGSSGSSASDTVAYQKNGTSWKEVPSPSSHDQNRGAQFDVNLKEDSNTAPKIYAKDRKTGREYLLLDLNPDFAKLDFGTVEDVTWTATDGHAVGGGLYLPPHYTPGRRYPLVIQTHGFDNRRFMIDGPFTSVFAAQPLASQGFVVLQVGGSRDSEAMLKTIETPKEAPYDMTEYEGAVDYLDKKGLIDRDRVGIIGFSRTVYAVEYALTHSKYLFAAATVADGINAGYFGYLVFPTTSDELLNGGPPVGEGLLNWLKNSPGFNLDKVQTPLRMESYGLSGGLLSEWEWFSGLSRLHKPVDLVYLPFAGHILVKPWDRMVSQQGNVDWFSFWLKKEEDPDHGKIEQYTRWRELRDLQQQNEPTFHVPLTD